MCRLFDVNLLWVQEVTLYFYEISAVAAKLAVQCVCVCDTSNLLTIARSHNCPRKKDNLHFQEELYCFQKKEG